MPGLDETTFRLLHEIRLRGVVAVDESDAVTQLVEVGFVARSSKGVRITPEGREEHTAWARLASGSDEAATVQRAYERFLPANLELVRICHDWQVRPGGIPNDHRDAKYDWSVIDRLRALDERAGPVVTRVGRSVTRFAVYRPQLQQALDAVDEGQHEWFTSPRCDSYHTVWMRLHEDLLLALGADRADEPDH